MVNEIALEFSPVLWMDSSSAASQHGVNLKIRHSEYRASHVLVVSLPRGGRIRTDVLFNCLVLH